MKGRRGRGEREPCQGIEIAPRPLGGEAPVVMFLLGRGQRPGLMYEVARALASARVFAPEDSVALRPKDHSVREQHSRRRAPRERRRGRSAVHVMARPHRRDASPAPALRPQRRKDLRPTPADTSFHAIRRRHAAERPAGQHEATRFASATSAGLCWTGRRGTVSPTATTVSADAAIGRTVVKRPAPALSSAPVDKAVRTAMV